MNHAEWSDNKMEADYIYELSPAEGIFYPAFDSVLCDDSQIQVDQGVRERLWDSLTFTGGRSFRIHWRGHVELGEYDSFLCFLGCPEGACMSGEAVVNGQRVELFRDEPGSDVPIELEGRLMTLDAGQPAEAGSNLLTDIYLTLNSSHMHNVVVLSWLGLVKSEKKAAAELAVPVWNTEWEEEVIGGRCGTIENNIVISAEEGERLRDLVRADERLTAQVRRNAEKGMLIDPVHVLREYAPQPPHMYRFVRVRDRGRENLEGPVLNLAIAGYLLEEPAYSRQAARLILSLVAMKWYEGPVCGMKGSHFHHVCFTEDHMLTEVSLALGFLGGVLKETARERMIDKIGEAWSVVVEKCKEPGYRSFMNQGVVGNRGALLGAVFLEMNRGGHKQDILDAYERHTRIVENYLTSEGHCAEGGAYFEYSFSTSILLWHVYARYTGKTWAQIVPEVFQRAGRYQEAIMSVNDRQGERIPINCTTGVRVSTLLLIFMTMVCDFPEGNNYLTARFEGSQVREEERSFDLLFYLYYRERLELHPVYRPIKEEISLLGSGLLSWRSGSTRLIVTAERNPYTGHFHEDRGGIVLEAEGTTLLPELGTTSYANPVSLLMSRKEYHNLACPDDLAMRVASEKGILAAAAAAHPLTKELTREDMAIPEARILANGEEKEGYRFVVDTGKLFGENISGIREGYLGRCSLCLKDRWTFPEEHPLLVTYLSYSPWKCEKLKGKAESGRMTICVDSRQPWEFETEDGMTDYNGREVYILRIRTSSATDQEVVSLITWHPLDMSTENSGRENRIALQEKLDQGGVIRIEKQGIYEIEDTLYIKSFTHLILGRGVILKRSSTGIGSFFLVNRGAFTGVWDTDITIEGLHLITNGVEARKNAAVYGLTGEISLYRIRHLSIFDFTCLDLPRLSFGMHICTFEDIVLERLRVEGRKDAVHLGTGRRFVIRHGFFKTFDDPIALNAHDYAVANPQMGWIEDGLIEDCHDLPDQDTTGYFCRILAGAWCDWFSGMEIQNSDTVVSGGRVYRAFQKPDGKKYISLTPPSHPEGMRTIDGINWVMAQEEVVYNCGCRNIHFKDIYLGKERETALSIHFDHDRYSRSVYPGAVMPVQENIVFENLVIQNKIGCLVRSITPVDTIKICNSVIGTALDGNSSIRLECLMGQEGSYPATGVVLYGNTCYGGMEALVECEEHRKYDLTAAANLNLAVEEARR